MTAYLQETPITFGEAILALGQIVLFAGFLALALERLTELLIVPFLKRVGQEWLTPYLAAVVGVAAALSFGIDLFSPIAQSLGLEVAYPVAGGVCSVLVMGGGSNLLHDLWPGRGIAARVDYLAQTKSAPK